MSLETDRRKIIEQNQALVELKDRKVKELEADKARILRENADQRDELLNRLNESIDQKRRLEYSVNQLERARVVPKQLTIIE